MPQRRARTTSRRVRNRHIMLMVLTGVVARSVRDPASLRRQLFKALWLELKRFAAPHIRDVALTDLIGSESTMVQGRLPRYSPMVLDSLCQARRYHTIFEFGTYRGDTAWLLAHNNPGARIFTLDFPGPEAIKAAKHELTDPEYFDEWERGKTFVGTQEASRITQLAGDSASFDFTPYSGQMDLIFIDASHSYSYVRCDTEAALTMLADGGTIVWDDYTYYPGIYAYLNELSPRLAAPIEHILDTRLAIYRARERPSGKVSSLGPAPISLGQPGREPDGGGRSALGNAYSTGQRRSLR